MYRLELVEQIKLRALALPSVKQGAAASPAAWRLGFTSLLTDVSSEMVSSALPIYLVLHLHVSPLAFGAIDGIYYGVAVALLSMTGGVLADRWRRHKEVAAVGYGVSAICKLALFAAGSAIGWVALITAIDRTAKGSRTAPRDAILSLSSSQGSLTTSFAVHRGLDAAGSLLGPLLGFALLSSLPRAYDALWLTSFVFALLGLSVLLLFVDKPPLATTSRPPSFGAVFRLAADRKDFRAVAIAAGLLAVATVSDAFIYLMLQRRSGASSQFFPLYYVITAVAYMLLTVPVARVADRFGRARVLLSGYGALLIVYAMVGSGFPAGGTIPMAPLLLFGLYYASTEGVLMAIASTAIPAPLRTGGLAFLTTVIGIAKMVSSLLFGWMWHSWGATSAILAFGTILAVAVSGSAIALRTIRDERPSEV